jgi:RimJ/RimL family protein N-acetyltransferase
VTVTEPVRIETERLVLDGHGVSDFEALCALWADPLVVRHIGGTPSTRTESWARLLRYRGGWALRGFGFWAMREKAGGRFVGDIGFKDSCREIEPSIFGLPEAGWVVAPCAQGKGYASEALAAALGWLDRQSEHPLSVCLIAPQNAVSIRLASRHGYGQATTVLFEGEATLLLRRHRP